MILLTGLTLAGYLKGLSTFMETKCAISVIVPVYNVESYLERCVKSIQAQTLQNIEIILINDGSDDNSGEYCDTFAKEDYRVKVFHQKNAGLSAARNKGLELAEGEWISFIDSDDFIHPQMLEKLLKNAVNSQTLIAVCGMASVNEKGVYINSFVPKFQTLEGQALHGYFMDYGNGYVCNKLFHSSLFKNIRFPLGKLFEDGYVLTYLLEAAQKAVFVDEVGYYYTQRKESITNKKIKQGMDISRQFDALESRQIKLDFIKDRYPELIPKAKKDLILTCCWLLYKTYKAKGINFKENKTVIIKAFNKEKKGSELNEISVLSAVFLISLSPWLFSVVYGIFDMFKKIINLISVRKTKIKNFF